MTPRQAVDRIMNNLEAIEVRGTRNARILADIQDVATGLADWMDKMAEQAKDHTEEAAPDGAGDSPEE